MLKRRVLLKQHEQQDRNNMDTKTECRYFEYSDELRQWIDEMYKQYGKRVINVSTCAYYSPHYINFIGYITILQEEQTNNID